MNENEIQLKVQALVDGELTGRKAEALQQRINDDAKLQHLHAKLTQMRGLIADSELPRPLPESRDFYWNKIAETLEHVKAELRQARGKIAYTLQRQLNKPLVAELTDGRLTKGIKKTVIDRLDPPHDASVKRLLVLLTWAADAVNALHQLEKVHIEAAHLRIDLKSSLTKFQHDDFPSAW